jgi:amino acid permease
VNELELLSQKRLNIVISCSIGFALVIFSTVAIEGYRTYGSNVRGDILLNYPENRQVTFLRICLGGMLGLHYPLQLGKCF